MPFNGLSIILSQPSRFDEKNGKIISGTAGDWFNRELAKNGILREDCYITTPQHGIDNNKLDSSKAILCLGVVAQHLLSNNKDVSLNEQRGSPFKYNNIPVISTYTPQDTHDFIDYEKKFNPLLNGSLHDNSGEEDDAEGEDEETETGKAHGKTKRRNFRFWCKQDIKKAARILQGDYTVIEPKLEILPSYNEIEYYLIKTKNQYFTHDIETDPQTNDVTVFSFNFSESLDAKFVPTTYIIPIRRYNYEACYGDNTAKIFVLYAIAMRDNISITHNGSSFDLFYLTWRYKIPFGFRNVDTMDSHHRLFPEVEKSLGHCISLYTDQPYHKNTAGSFAPANTKQEYALWTYNGIDTHTTRLVACKEMEYAAKIPGAIESIKQANDMIAPYLMMSFTGIAIDDKKRQERIHENDRRIMALLKVLDLLCGRKLNPASTKQVREYLYNKKVDGGLGLSVVSFTKKGVPQCDAKSIFRIYLNYPEIVTLYLIIQIRRLQKETSALMFKSFNWP